MSPIAAVETMTDCYRILGVEPRAKPAQIRAAYLARMKLCHPDSGIATPPGEAAEVSRAYWQLRDPERRAEHDRALLAASHAPRPTARPGKRIAAPRPTLTLAKTPSARRRRAKPAAPPGAKSARRRARGKRLDPVRAMAGVAACSLALIGFVAAATQLGGREHGRARAEAQPPPPSPPAVRRALDPQLAQSATGEFRSIVADAGLAGAHQFARQCLMELTARPSMTILDFCLAFDDEGASFERRSGPDRRSARRYFAADQRFGRYASTAREIAPGDVRESLLSDVRYFSEGGE